MMAASKAVSKKPNIILINCDDLGYGDLGCYGSGVNRSPVLDKMAAEGLLLRDFCVAAAVCSPSRGALMTGCYPARFGFSSFDGVGVLLPGHGVGLSTGETTIATLLRNVGYRTKIIGKWHCGDQTEFLPTNHGFDSFYGLPYSNDMGRQVGNTERYTPLPLMRDGQVIQAQPDQTCLTERYVEEAVGFVRESAGRPFFLYLAHFYVHLPLFVSDRFLNESSNGRYGAAVACIDWAMGVILFELKRLGLDENTLIVFTSDHGSRGRGEGGSNGVLRGTKGTTWEGGFRVPCIMRWPAGIPAGSVSDELVSAMDLLPTFAAAAGAPLTQKHKIDGENLLGHIQNPGKVPSARETMFYYFMENLEAVRDRTWKLHVRKRDVLVQELYNLKADPGETQNLYAQYPEIVKDLSAKLEACRRELGDGATGVIGSNTRPIGRVENPRAQTAYDPEYPYMIAMYDLK
jgi:arylsulfatase A